jgi:hypothetical protein
MEDVSTVAEKAPLLGVGSDKEEHPQATLDLTTVNNDTAHGNGEEEAGKKDEDNDLGENTDKDEDKKEEMRIRTKEIGVWRIFYQEKPWGFLPGVNLFQQFKGIVETLPYLWRFTSELWAIAPGYLLVWMFSTIWKAVDGAISLWVTAHLIDRVSLIRKIYIYHYLLDAM